MTWDYETWGSSRDPIHKSDLNSLVGKFGCLQQFARKKTELAEGGARTYEEANGKMCAGNAVHSVLHRLCKSPIAVEVMKHKTETISEHSLTIAYDEEFAKEVGGRAVSWFKTNGEKHRDECLQMIFGVVRDFRNHVDEVILAEAGFVYCVDGVWLTGAIDLLYKPVGVDGIGMADWKTGAQKPHQIDLDHGWEAAIYGLAVRDAWFVPFDSVTPKKDQPHRLAMEEACIQIAIAVEALEHSKSIADTRVDMKVDPPSEAAAMIELDRVVCEFNAVRFDEYPERLRLVHLKDYVPYARKSNPMLSRPEELEWAGLAAPAKYPREKGDQRGPGWYRINRTAAQTPRMKHLLNAVVEWIQLGMFPAAPGEMCSRCRFREPCLVDGYKPVGRERRRLDLITKDFDGFTGLD